MKNSFIICKKELTSYFYSPIAYVVITVFLIFSGIFFRGILLGYMEFSMKYAQYVQYDPYIAQRLAQSLNLAEGVFRPLFGNISVIMLFMLPLLTMRLLSEEKKSGTFELLLTYPIRDIETVLGKFIACCLVFAMMIGLTLIYPLFLASFDTPGMEINIDPGPLVSSYIGLLLLGGAFIAFGILASSLTSSQIIAAVISFGALLIFYLLGSLAYDAGPVLEGILRHISLLEHFENFSKGVITSQDVIYYLNFTIFCLFLTLRSLESNKWRG